MPELKERQQEEMKLWRRWQSGDTAALSPLMKSYEPLVQSWVNKLSTSPLPKIFIETEVKKQVLDSFERFDPKRGVQLNTFVNSRLPKVLRTTVYAHTGLGRIPEERQRKISTYLSSKERLEELLRRPPTAMELAADLSWNLQEVERMEKELRPKKLLTEEGAFTFQSDETEQKALQYVYMSLPPEHQIVFEHHFGWAGKPKLNTGELAKRMKMEPKAIRSIKKSLGDKLETALQITAR